MRMVFCLAALSLVLTGCVWTDTATDFNGLTDHENQALMHINRTKLGLNLFVTAPLLEDASLQTSVAELTAEAKSLGGWGVRLVQSDVTTWWWIFPPFSLIVTPVSSNVAADVMKAGR